MAFIVHIATGFPSHYYSQEELTAVLRGIWSNNRSHRLEQFHQNLMVNGRYLALPLEAYGDEQLPGFGARNDAWLWLATGLAEETICRLLAETGIRPNRYPSLRLPQYWASCALARCPADEPHPVFAYAQARSLVWPGLCRQCGWSGSCS